MAVQVEDHDTERLEHLCRYIARPPLAAECLTLTARGRVRYEFRRLQARRHNPERIELAEEFLARLVHEQGIGSRGEVRVRRIVRGKGSATVAWSGEKGVDMAVRIDL